MSWAQLKQIVMAFGFLQILLMSNYLHASLIFFDIWVCKWFFFGYIQTHCSVQLNTISIQSALEALFYSLIALCGYIQSYAVLGDTSGSDMYRGIFEHCQSNIKAIFRKYYWLCFVPWSLAFGQQWLENIDAVATLLQTTDDLFDITNIMRSLSIVMVIYWVQATLSSFVLYQIYSGWKASHLIDDRDKEEAEVIST